FTESVPFHALFGIFMWLLIQDQADPKVKVIAFGDHEAFDQGVKGKLIGTLLPEDFGTPGYALRRATAIKEHFTLLSEQKEELLWTFDYWVEPSADLRQYLWAHRPQDVTKAREIVSILPADVTVRILEYLVADYWRRYCGWPDMLVHNQDEFFFAEVKSSKDKLREDQKN
ncbi:MAG: VRR-NUC domain-containing protein, partial [Anaerolineae bacterium]